MALRARLQNTITEENAGVRKVEARVFQGPTVHRAALGEMKNLAHGNLNLKSTKPLDLVKQQQQPQLPSKCSAGLTKSSIQGKQPTVSLKRYKAKENIQPNQAEKEEVKKEVLPTEDADTSKMEVEELAMAFSTQRLNIGDIDAQDSDNPQLVSDYVCDIYDYLRVLEDLTPVQHHYLEGQTITHKMRAILIDWLVQVHHRFTLLQETLYLTVGIVDRYLQTQKNLPRLKLQLVGVTSMFIACKYEEMYCPDVGDFVYVTDKAYTKREILCMEIQILKKLKFNISFPLPLHFLRRNSKAGGVNSKQHTLAKFLMELCLQEYSMCHFKASIMAAAALLFTLKLLGDGDWNDTLIYHSTYTEQQLMPVVCKMAAIVIKSQHSKQQAVRQKYDSTKFMNISKIAILKSDLVSKLAERSALS